LQSKWEHGEWAGLAPIGYLNVTSERERRLRGGAIVVDAETAPRVKQLFQLCESGGYSLRDLTTMAVKEWRLQFRRSGDTRPQGRYPIATIERILKNPFYYGVIRVKGKLLPGSHEPLISKATFDRVQRILSGRRAQSERPSKHSFPFSSLIACSLCGHHFTAYTVRKTSGRSYTYYRCSMGSKGCAQPHVTEREIIEVITPALKQVTLTSAERDRCIEVIHEINLEETEAVVSDLDQLRREHAALVRKSSHILDMYIAGELTREEKLAKTAEVQEQTKALDIQITGATQNQHDWIELAEQFFESLSDAENIFDASNAIEKRALLRSLHIELLATPEKLRLNVGTAATIVMNRGDRPAWRALVEKVRTALMAT
jgi:site-specific DNA recombinase